MDLFWKQSFLIYSRFIKFSSMNFITLLKDLLSKKKTFVNFTTLLSCLSHTYMFNILNTGAFTKIRVNLLSIFCKPDLWKLFAIMKRYKNIAYIYNSGLYYKTLRIYNLQNIDIFHRKLVSFLLPIPFIGLDKHTSLLQSLLITNP
jgi:hypothetical protein